MKKIFAISFLSVFAVVGLARADYSGYYASGTDASQNYNLASVNYVKGLYDSAVQEAEQLVVTSDKQTTVDGSRWYPGFEGSDYAAPTIKYMENSIAEAVEGVDTSGLVEKAQVIKSDDKALSDGTTDLSSADADVIVPTVGMVEENFAPRVAQVAYNNGENTYIEKPSDLPYGSYALVVDVYEDQTTYRWVAMSTGNGGGDQIGCETTAGNVCPK